MRSSRFERPSPTPAKYVGAQIQAVYVCYWSDHSKIVVAFSAPQFVLFPYNQPAADHPTTSIIRYSTWPPQSIHLHPQSAVATIGQRPDPEDIDVQLDDSENIALFETDIYIQFTLVCYCSLDTHLQRPMQRISAKGLFSSRIALRSQQSDTQLRHFNIKRNMATETPTYKYDIPFLSCHSQNMD